MNPKGSTPRMTTSIACAVAILTLATGDAPATDSSAYAYLVASQPRLAGRVVTVSGQRIVVDTDQGRRVALELDSGAISPVASAPVPTARRAGVAMEEAGRARPMAPAGSGVDARPVASSVRSREGQRAGAQDATAHTPPATGGPGSLPQRADGESEAPPSTGSRRGLVAVLHLVAIGAVGAVAIGRRLYTTT
jgi:hypothetical protein